MILKDEIAKKYENGNNLYDFIKDYFKINDILTQKLDPFCLYEQQKELLEMISKNNFTVCKKCRQTGVTSALVMYILCKALFSEDNETFMFVTLDESNVNRTRNMIMDFFEQLPLNIFKNDITTPLIKGYKKTEITFFNNTKILIRNINNPYQLCGVNEVNTFIFDEIAFADNKAVGSFISMLGTYMDTDFNKTKFVFVSTPNGKNNLFYFLYDILHSYSFDWFKHPVFNENLIWLRNNDVLIRFDEDYDELIEDGWKPSSPWYVKMCKSFNNDSQKIAQELDCQFI